MLTPLRRLTPAILVGLLLLARLAGAGEATDGIELIWIEPSEGKDALPELPIFAEVPPKPDPQKPAAWFLHYESLLVPAELSLFSME
ncbi:MAG: hypothetical protein BWZ08_01618 [candidate division BRC1 bacterium ADurb.BinA292]|nr:MAG: hypothetical protein BWZ08_01618 [candidate division BRC1 bacterium ADurb.BinA292]